jgi:hypothetical protein
MALLPVLGSVRTVAVATVAVPAPNPAEYIVYLPLDIKKVDTFRLDRICLHRDEQLMYQPS